jgi:hypothetical protein
MALLYVLFSKLVPIISIWELKAGEHPEPKTARPVEEDVQEPEAVGELV